MNDTYTIGHQYTGKLFVSQSVYCILYGGKYGYIKSIAGEQRPDTIRSLAGAGCVMTGGSANITVRFDTGHDSVVPEAIVRGVQWYLSTEAADTAALDAEYTASKAEKAAVALAKKNAHAQALRSLPAEYPYLETLAAYEKRTGKTYGSLLCAAGNIRRHLAHVFPGIKFSVKTERYSGGESIRINWTDGPTSEQVDAITKRYQDHQMDYTGDYHDPAPTAFTDLFGGSKFVFTNRHMSEATAAAVKPWAESLKRDDPVLAEGAYVEQIAWRLIAHYPLPAGAVVTGVEAIPDVNAGSGVWDFFRPTFTTPAPLAPVTPTTPEAVTPTDPTPYSVEHERDWTWIRFPAKPADATLEALRANLGAKFSGKRAAWYITTHIEPANIAAALGC
jgi:hypothetical protein